FRCRDYALAQVADAAYDSQEQFCSRASAISINGQQFDGPCVRYEQAGSGVGYASQADLIVSQDRCKGIVALRGSTLSVSDWTTNLSATLTAGGNNNFSTDMIALGVGARFHYGFHTTAANLSSTTQSSKTILQQIREWRGTCEDADGEPF